MSYGSYNTLNANYKVIVADEKWSAQVNISRNSSDNDYKYLGTENQVNENGQFYGAGKVGVWWSSTNDPSGVKLFTRTLSNDKQEVIKFAANPKIGAYVRCIRD